MGRRALATPGPLGALLLLAAPSASGGAVRAELAPVAAPRPRAPSPGK